MATKFLFIHQDCEPADMKLLDTLGAVLFFRDTSLPMTYTDVFARYDVVVLNVSNKSYKDWFASYRNGILGNANIRLIFLHPVHCHVDEILMRTLRDEWKVSSVIKNLPQQWNSRDDLIAKLINNIHLATLEMPAVESCFKSLLYAVAQKFGCGK